MEALAVLTSINVLSYFSFNQCCLMFDQYHVFFNVVVLTVVCMLLRCQWKRYIRYKLYVCLDFDINGFGVRTAIILHFCWEILMYSRYQLSQNQRKKGFFQICTSVIILFCLF